MAGQTRSVGAVSACAPSDSVACGWPVQLAEREDFQRLRANQQQSVHELQRLQAQLEAERREAADRSAAQHSAEDAGMRKRNVSGSCPVSPLVDSLWQRAFHNLLTLLRKRIENRLLSVSGMTRA
jgi:hypothetical protein